MRFFPLFAVAVAYAEAGIPEIPDADGEELEIHVNAGPLIKPVAVDRVFLGRPVFFRKLFKDRPERLARIVAVEYAFLWIGVSAAAVGYFDCLGLSVFEIIFKRNGGFPGRQRDEVLLHAEFSFRKIRYLPDRRRFILFRKTVFLQDAVRFLRRHAGLQAVGHLQPAAPDGSVSIGADESQDDRGQNDQKNLQEFSFFRLRCFLPGKLFFAGRIVCLLLHGLHLRKQIVSVFAHCLFYCIIKPGFGKALIFLSEKDRQAASAPVFHFSLPGPFSGPYIQMQPPERR